MTDQSRTWAGVDVDCLRQGLRIVALRALGDPDVVDDVVQETLARTARALREGRVRERDRLAAFARGIARNVIVDVIRERSRRESLPDAGARHQDPAPDALETLVTAEEKRRLVAALSRLSSADRELLRLAFYEGLTSAEIGEQLGLRHDLVRKRKSRAVERLRRAFLGSAVESHDSEDSTTDIRDISDASTTDEVGRQR
jgi:RNA polymerase sigma-70 factor (ECF subfamily)